MDTESFINDMGSSPAKGKRSKRLRPWFDEHPPWSCSEDESEDEEMAAHSLMLLSHDDSGSVFPKRAMKKAKEEKKSYYECRTCGKRFLSFQALGGHRTSCCHTSHLAHHTTAESEQTHEKISSGGSNKMKLHVCPICCRVFSSGQALGGHKRTHSTPPPHSSVIENERAELDLNMPAPLDDCGGTQTVDSSPAMPLFTVARPHCKEEYERSPPSWWMTTSGKRAPSVFNGSIADGAEKAVLVGRDLGFKQDLFTVAPVN